MHLQANPTEGRTSFARVLVPRFQANAVVKGVPAASLASHNPSGVLVDSNMCAMLQEGSAENGNGAGEDDGRGVDEDAAMSRDGEINRDIDGGGGGGGGGTRGSRFRLQQCLTCDDTTPARE